MEKLALSTAAHEVNAPVIVQNFGQFISADFGNLADRHIIRCEVCRKFIDTALRGTEQPLKDGLAMAKSLMKGKNHKIANAWIQGLTAIGEVNRYCMPDTRKPYEGKLSEQPELVKAIAVKAAELTEIFSAKFAEFFPIEEPAKLTKAEKDAKAKESAERKDKAGREWAAENGYIAKEGTVLIDELAGSDALQIVLKLLPKLDSLPMLDSVTYAIDTLRPALIEQDDQQKQENKEQALTDRQETQAAGAHGTVSINGASIEAAQEAGQVKSSRKRNKALTEQDKEAAAKEAAAAEQFKQEQALFEMSQNPQPQAAQEETQAA